MSEKFIVTVSVTLTIEASSHTVAMVKAAKKFSNYIVNQIDATRTAAKRERYTRGKKRSLDRNI